MRSHPAKKTRVRAEADAARRRAKLWLEKLLARGKAAAPPPRRKSR
jgi:hypothetical protein